MTNLLIDHLKKDGGYNRILENTEGSQYIHGMSEESLPHFIYALWQHSARPIFFLVESEARANKLYESALAIPGIDIMRYPRSEISFHDIGALKDESEMDRIRVMTRLARGDNFIIIGSSQSLVKKIGRPELLADRSFTINIEDEIELEDLELRLRDLSYKRVGRVEAKGDYAVRGGIIDIYPLDYKDPVRIELFDTEIDSMRLFEVNSQRSVREIDNIFIGPARENLLKASDYEVVLEGLEYDLKNIGEAYGPDERKVLEDKFVKIYDKLENNMSLANMDLIMAYLEKSSYANILDYFDGIILYDDLDRVFASLESTEAKFMEDLAYQIESGQAFPSQSKAIYSEAEIRRKAKGKATINISQLKKRPKRQEPDHAEKILSSEIISYVKQFPRLVEEIKAKLELDYQIIICTGNENLAQSLKTRLEKEGLKPRYTKDISEDIGQDRLVITPFSLGPGFEYINTKTIFISRKEIYGQQRKNRKKKKKRPIDQLTVADLNFDDYVVHENHGIAIYKGLEEIDINGNKKDYLILEYRGADKLYVPTDQMDLVQRYVSSGDKKPTINKLGTATWARTKERAKKQVEEIADELVDLYAKRAKEKGHAFSKDTEWQSEFENSFEFEETSGQLKAVAEIKEDMESDKPMDRILLGDVGFGKTEVALRAAFKANMDGKQVAFLVPTTILAQQHYSNISKRLKDFPVNIEVLSRFKSKREQDLIIEKVKMGEIDLIIGTHRLLSDDVTYRDLGLLIIDEEQRFGVKHKEKLKIMKENIDVLTLTATPIPRTLQMGLVGARDMSVLEEGPEDRYPTRSYVLEYDPPVIRDAINRELDRDGQVYFVYNRVADMDKILKHLQELVPQARIVMAHGQMRELELEKIMADFAGGEYDILVSTSIIETGVDIHNVNTLIIYNADKMGLSQLYQLKGRVGRSNRSSYAYFTYKQGKSLTEISEKRLKAIKDFGEFGSGLKIAMWDLELRGAGNILGESQSGHIDSIGYDLYMKFLEDAVKANKEDIGPRRNEVNLDIGVDSYIPNDYIASSEDKIEMYQRIASISTMEEYYDIIDELTDRYGDLPKAVLNIIEISFMKNLASMVGITEISGNKDKLKFAYESRNEYGLEDLERLSSKFEGNIEFNLSKDPSFSLSVGSFKEIYIFFETIAEIKGTRL